MKQNKETIYSVFIKRLIDIVFSALFMLLFSWLYGIIAILVRIHLGAPVLYIQERPGKIDRETGKENIFKLYKFRSMTDERDECGELLPKERRLTKFGKRLRATSMDELPEMWNVLKGDMSLVGPRPLLKDYLFYYNDFERKRHKVKPGLTGWAQVNGRNGAQWKRRFELDAEYVERISFAFDLKIVLLTIKKIITHEGVEFEADHQPIAEYFANRK